MFYISNSISWKFHDIWYINWQIQLLAAVSCWIILIVGYLFETFSRQMQSNGLNLTGELLQCAVTAVSIPVLVSGLCSGSLHPWEAGWWHSLKKGRIMREGQQELRGRALSLDIRFIITTWYIVNLTDAFLTAQITVLHSGHLANSLELLLSINARCKQTHTHTANTQADFCTYPVTNTHTQITSSWWIMYGHNKRWKSIKNNQKQ